jgi:excinuclease UvrABC nuclease subunit
VKITASPIQSGTFDIPGDDQTYVYRIYCRCGDLLYVGMTNNLFVRFAAHRANRRARWERRAVRIEWDLYSCRGIAELVERELIQELHPIYNEINAMPTRRWKPLSWPTMPTAAEIEKRRLDRMRAMSIGDRL